jgi:hypothetical protein
MNKIFEHVGGVVEVDRYMKAMDKVEQGIKLLTNQATARFKLFQEMPQDGRGFREWSQLVVEQANRCDWANYDKSMAARDAIIFQMEDKKLHRKIIAEDPALQEVIKLGIANEQAVKAADRFKPKVEQEAPQTRIAVLEEQVRALGKSGAPGGKKLTSCQTCTRPTHGEGKCRALTTTCHACKKVDHYKASKACTKSGRGKSTVNAVESEAELGDTDSEAGWWRNRSGANERWGKRICSSRSAEPNAGHMAPRSTCPSWGGASASCRRRQGPSSTPWCTR